MTKLVLCKSINTSQGIDFNEIYAPVAKMSSIRVKTYIATTHDLELQQANVVTSFLLCTRVDEAHALDFVVKYCENNDNSHCVAVKRTIRYLNTTKHFQLTDGDDIEEGLECYADASWSGDGYQKIQNR